MSLPLCSSFTSVHINTSQIMSNPKDSRPLHFLGHTNTEFRSIKGEVNHFSLIDLLANCANISLLDASSVFAQKIFRFKYTALALYFGNIENWTTRTAQHCFSQLASYKLQLKLNNIISPLPSTIKDNVHHQCFRRYPLLLAAGNVNITISQERIRFWSLNMYSSLCECRGCILSTDNANVCGR